MKTVYDVLTEAQEKIRDPKRWCQSCSAIRADGWYVSARDPEAVAWCAAGAVISVTESHEYQEPYDILTTAALEQDAGGGVESVNDFEDHDAVMRMFDRARDLAKEAAGA